MTGKLNAVMKHCDVLNAVTLRDYFESLGLGFTDASKKPIVEEFQDISEVSFLKRSFRYHKYRDWENCMSFRIGCTTVRFIMGRLHEGCEAGIRLQDR